LSVRLYRTGGRTVARVSGEADLEGARTLERALEHALAFPGGLDLDLTAVRFCDCSGLNVLLRVRRHAEAIGTTVTLRAAAPCVERLLALTDTRALFTAAIPEPVDEPRHPDEIHFTGLATGVHGRADRPERLLVTLPDGRHIVTVELTPEQSARITAVTAQWLVPPALAAGPLLVRRLGSPVSVHLLETPGGSAFALLGVQQQDPDAHAA
jgi:anti-anti-sigma factor